MTKVSDSVRDCFKLGAKTLAEKEGLGLFIYLFGGWDWGGGS